MRDIRSTEHHLKSDGQKKNRFLKVTMAIKIYFRTFFNLLFICCTSFLVLSRRLLSFCNLPHVSLLFSSFYKLPMWFNILFTSNIHKSCWSWNRSAKLMLCKQIKTLIQCEAFIIHFSSFSRFTFTFFKSPSELISLHYNFVWVILFFDFF